jgi:ferredoxin/flavodoxin---NADP+ reductase
MLESSETGHILAPSRKSSLNATIVGWNSITTDLKIIRVRPDNGVSDFIPGQYVALGLEVAYEDESGQLSQKLIKRAYSIGSTPLEKEYLEFYIAIVANGALTSQMTHLKVGDRIFCGPKIKGHFVLKPAPDTSNLIMVATGTGLAPFISMLKTPGTWKEGRKVALLHGVRYGQDLAYGNEIETIQRQHPQLSYFPVVSREDIPGTSKGYVQKLFEEQMVPTDPFNDHVFLCGNPDMIEAVETRLLARGFSVHSTKTPGNLHYEKYW